MVGTFHNYIGLQKNTGPRSYHFFIDHLKLIQKKIKKSNHRIWRIITKMMVIVIFIKYHRVKYLEYRTNCVWVQKKNFRLDLVLCVKNKGRNYGHNAVVSQAAQLDFDGSMINGCLG